MEHVMPAPVATPIPDGQDEYLINNICMWHGILESLILQHWARGRKSAIVSEDFTLSSPCSFSPAATWQPCAVYDERVSSS